MGLPTAHIAGARTSQASAQWADPAVLERVGYAPGETWFGYTLTARGAPFGYSDDRHIVTIAGNRAGKGTSTIIPNLCEHPGSLICIDPKGENASITAARRGKGSLYAEGLGQAVWVLDPFKTAHVDDSLRGGFNPLDCIDPDSDEAVDDAGAIAEALIVATNSKDAHWDESARVFLQGLILYVVVTESAERRHLPRVRDLLTLGDREAAASLKENGESIDPFLLLLARMEQREEFYGVIAAAATTLTGAGENERGSILSTARRNTSFIDSPGMRETLSRSSFTLDDLKTAPEGLSLYLCLPARRLDTHGRWLRAIVMLALGHMERLGRRPATGHPVLFLLDEFATLGHMSSLEKAAGFIAGYGVKLWVILQDLNQLKATYKDRWETFLGNAGVLQFFGNSDMTTLEYISNRLGQTELRQETTGSSSSSSESSSFSHSESTSLSSGRSRSKSGGYNSSGWSHGSNFSEGETFGKTEGSTYGTSTSISRNESIAVAPLMRPDEIAKFFGRGTGRQILFVAGAPPIVLGQTIYFRDPYFAGKFDPHPDHLDTIPPTLDSLKSERLALEQQIRDVQIKRKRKWQYALAGIAATALFAVPVVKIASYEPVPIPLDRLSLHVEGLELEEVAAGHMLKIRVRLANRSDSMLRGAQIGWQGRYCMRRLTNGAWGDCTMFPLPVSKLNMMLPSNSNTVLVESLGPVAGLRGTVSVGGKIMEATE
jgi:type IV secretion system protein VirD4